MLLALGLLASLAIPASAQFNASLFDGRGGTPTPAVFPIGAAASAFSSNTASVSAVSVPAGSTVICDAITYGGFGSISDGVNTYQAPILQQGGISGAAQWYGQMFYAYNVTLTTATITVTAPGVAGGAHASLSCIYATNMPTSNPHDATVDATAEATGTSVSVTAAHAPAVANSLMVTNCMCYRNSVNSFSGSGSPWTAFPAIPSGLMSGEPLGAYQFTSTSQSWTAQWPGSNTIIAPGITAFKP